MESITLPGRPALLGGLLVGAMFSALSLSEAGGVSALDVIENHAVFHIIQAPVYALLNVELMR